MQKNHALLESEIPKPKRWNWGKRTQEERFFEKINKEGPNGCWVWTAYRWQGYGMMSYDFRLPPNAKRPLNGEVKIARATHISYTLHKGSIPKGMQVLHHCDNPPCVNPDHLYLGKDMENRRDCVARGRIARGYALPHTILSEDNVREIRNMLAEKKLSQERIGELFGVSRGAIRGIVRGENHKHVK